MKVPTWAITVGVIMILLGGCSPLSDYSQINTKENIADQQEIMEKISENGDSEEFGEIAESMMDMMKMSEYTQTWLVRFGYIGLVISLLYVLAGIFLINPKPFSIKLAYAALILSAVATIAQLVVLNMDEEANQLMSLGNSFSSGFGIFIDLILLVIVGSADKSRFTNPEEDPFHNQEY